MKVDPALGSHVAYLARPIALLSEGATEPPKELRLFPAGVVETTKGPFKFDSDSCTSVSRCFADLGRLLHFDYEHASVFATMAPDPAEAGKAAGQFKVECRDGECWATDIRWTPKARDKILAREFLYTSPTFRHDEEGRVLEVFCCALTNDPAIKHREPLMASRMELSMKSGWVPMCFGQCCSAASVCCQACPCKESCCSVCRCACPPDPSGNTDSNSMQMSANHGLRAFLKEHAMRTVLARLGLADTASEAEALVALNRIQEQLAGIIALSGKPSAGEALGVLQAWKIASEQTASLSAKVAELESAKLSREIDGLIEEAKKDGRLAPASEKVAREVASKAGVESLKAMLAVLPKTGKPHVEREPGKEGEVSTLSAEELQGCKLVGLDPKKYAEHKAASLARRNGTVAA